MASLVHSPRYGYPNPTGSWNHDVNGFAIKLTRLSDALALLWAACIGYLSLSPLDRLPPITPFSDKVEHFAAYALLSFLTLWARRPGSTGALWLLAIICYGGLIELLQPYVNRNMELADLLANCAGVLAGALLVRAARQRSHSRSG